MIELSAFSSRVAPNVLSAPDAIIQQAVLDACIEFCEKSGIVRENLDPITVGPTTYEVELDTPSQMKVVQVLRAWIDTKEIFPINEDRADVFGFVQSVTGQTVSASTPQGFNEVASGVLTLTPRPDAAYTLTVRCSLKPSRTATQVADVLLEDWATEIADGALSILYAMNTAWKDQSEAKVRAASFAQGIGNAMLESKRGRNRAEDIVTPVRI